MHLHDRDAPRHVRAAGAVRSRAMRSRELVSFLVVAVAAAGGCKGKAAPPGPGSGSGSAVAVKVAPPLDAAAPVAVAVAVDAGPPPCLPTDGERTLSYLAATENEVTLCTVAVAGAPAPHCIGVALQTGNARIVPEPAAPVEVAPGGYAVQDTAEGVQLCKGSLCTKLALDLTVPKDAAPAPTHDVAIAKSGLVAVARDSGGLGLFDTSSGRKMKVLVPNAKTVCAGPAHFLDEVVFATITDCTGTPSAKAALYSPQGVLIASLESLNFEGSLPVRLAGDTWVAPDYGAMSSLVFEGKTGRVLRQASGLPTRFTQCEACFPLGTSPLFKVPLIAPMPSGKYTAVSNTGFWVIDPSTGKTEKSYPIPACAPTAPAAADGLGSGSGSGSGSAAN